jgi:hypothetical protein
MMIMMMALMTKYIRKFEKKGFIGLGLRRVTSVSRSTRIFLFLALFNLAE